MRAVMTLKVPGTNSAGLARVTFRSRSQATQPGAPLVPVVRVFTSTTVPTSDC